MLYFAYGSNMNKNQMLRRCSTARPLGRALLRDYRLVMRQHADIDGEEGSLVRGALWEITDSDRAMLDTYEGYPGYYGKHQVEVETSEGSRSALVYEMTLENKAGGGTPTDDYKYMVMQGFIDFGYPADLAETMLHDALDAGSEKSRG